MLQFSHPAQVLWIAIMRLMRHWDAENQIIHPSISCCHTLKSSNSQKNQALSVKHSRVLYIDYMLFTCMIHEHASHQAYFAESGALFYRFLKTCTKYPHKVMSRIQRVAEYLMENIVFLLLSVILETLIPVARQTNNSSNLMMTCFGWEANAESFQVLRGRLWRSMDVWDNAYLRYSLADFLSRCRFMKCSAKLWPKILA